MRDVAVNSRLELPIVRTALAGRPLGHLVGQALVVTVVMIVVRVAWTFLWAYLPAKLGGGGDERPPWRHVFFVGWAGIRGGDSLVIALALPLATRNGAPFPERDLIIILTFGAILATLVVQGLTLTPLIRLLGLRPAEGVEPDETRARQCAIEAGLRRLATSERRASAPPGVVEALEREHRNRLETLKARGSGGSGPEVAEADAYRDLRLEMIEAERAELLALRDRDEIDDDDLRAVQRDLDLEEVLLAGPGDDAG